MLRWTFLLLGVLLSFGSTASAVATQPRTTDGEHATLPAPADAAEEVSEEEATLDEAPRLQDDDPRSPLADRLAAAPSPSAPPLTRPPRR